VYRSGVAKLQGEKMRANDTTENSAEQAYQDACDIADAKELEVGAKLTAAAEEPKACERCGCEQ